MTLHRGIDCKALDSRTRATAINPKPTLKQPQAYLSRTYTRSKETLLQATPSEFGAGAVPATARQRAHASLSAAA